VVRHLNNGSCERCAEILKDACPELQQFATDLQKQHPDAHVSCSYRGEKDQNDAFARGNSNARFGESPHNFRPSLAIDFFRLTQAGGASFDRPWFIAVLMPAARAAGLDPGGDFRSFKDYPHVEVKDWKSRGTVKDANQAS
jgi:peptidoglycan L-alanyl-D-glutamate endopeptidase CwlK